MKREFLRPLLITIILIAVYRLGILLPIPFLDAEGIKQQFDSSNPSFALQGDLSIFMLGIMPYVSAYILVEIFSLFIPFLKRLRSGDLKGRLKLKRISLVLALILAIYQANALVSGLKSMKLSNGNLVLNVSIFEHVFLVCVLVCGFCLLVVLCELISRFGIGHGISIIILSSICGKFISRLPVFLAQVGYGNLSSLIIPLIVICGLIAFAYVLLKTKISIPCYHEKDNTTVDYFQLNLAPSSRVALTYGAAIIILPLTLSSFWGTESGFANNFHPGTLGYKLSSIIFVIMFSYLLGWAFLHPRKRVSKMRARGWHIANMDTTAESFMLKRQFNPNYLK